MSWANVYQEDIDPVPVSLIEYSAGDSSHDAHIKCVLKPLSEMSQWWENQFWRVQSPWSWLKENVFSMRKEKWQVRLFPYLSCFSNSNVIKGALNNIMCVSPVQFQRVLDSLSNCAQDVKIWTEKMIWEILSTFILYIFLLYIFKSISAEGILRQSWYLIISNFHRCRLCYSAFVV